MITGVAVIPLSSQKDANKAIKQARTSQPASQKAQGNAQIEESDESNPEDEPTEANVLESPVDELLSPRNNAIVDSSIAQEVIGNQGRPTRVGANWFSKRNWMPGGSFFPGFKAKGSKLKEPIHTNEEYTSLGAGVPEAKAATEVASTSMEETSQQQQQREGEALASASKIQTPDLMHKLLRYTKLLFSSRNFFYSHDYDLTRSYAGQDKSRPNIPLYCKVDPLVCCCPLHHSGFDIGRCH